MDDTVSEAYVVRRGSVFLLPGDDNGGVLWGNFHDAVRLTRPDAENRKQFLGRGATTHRVTLIVEQVGLRWEQAEWGPIHRLFDGTKRVAVVCGHQGGCMDHFGPAWSMSDCDNGAEWFEKPTLDEAKAAAMAEVRRGWACDG